ncbi:MAG: NADH-quinone oxidoreductase subunit G, partial [Nitrospirae bacterium CG17_big_fil_post_rev_8_21_14_2_50_50_9]
LTKGANSQGAWISGAIPHRSDTGLDISHTGFNYKQMLEDKSNLKYFFLYNIEPEYDAYDYKKLMAKLSNADKIVLFTPYLTDSMKDYA